MSKRSLLLKIHKDLAAGDLKLPSLPLVCLKIKKVAADPNADIPMISKVAEIDPAFCGYLLQISNSPIYRGAVDINKINLAIGRLGVENTCNMAMTYAVRAMFKPNRKVMAKRLELSWRNSTYTAAVASVIADKAGLNFDPDEVLLAGLLQDIGCLPLIDKATKYKDLINDEESMQFLFNRYAASIGAAILRKWRLDEKFVQVAKNRDYWKYNEVPEANLVDLILVSKLHTYIGQKQFSQPPRINLVPAFIKLQLEASLSPEQSLLFIKDAKQRISEICGALGS